MMTRDEGSVTMRFKWAEPAENIEKMQKIIGCIPARAESSRFPGKPLCDILGKPMIVRVSRKSPIVRRSVKRLRGNGFRSYI